MLTGILSGGGQIQLVTNFKSLVFFAGRSKQNPMEKHIKQPLTRGPGDGIHEIYQSHGSYKYWKSSYFLITLGHCFTNTKSKNIQVMSNLAKNGMSFSLFWGSFFALLKRFQVSIHQCFSFPQSNGGNRSCCIRTYAWYTS